METKPQKLHFEGQVWEAKKEPNNKNQKEKERIISKLFFFFFISVRKSASIKTVLL